MTPAWWVCDLSPGQFADEYLAESPSGRGIVHGSLALPRRVTGSVPGLVRVWEHQRQGDQVCIEIPATGHLGRRRLWVASIEVHSSGTLVGV